MKKNYGLWIVLITFGFGIAATFVWLKFYPRTYKFEEVVSANVQKIEYCELVRNPYKYDGEIVRVNANLNWFMHGFYLTDANCSGEDDSTKTAINFNERKRENFSKYVEKFKYTGETPKPIEIVAVGVFTYKMRIGGSDGIEDRTRLQFEIYNIEYSSR